MTGDLGLTCSFVLTYL